MNGLENRGWRLLEEFFNVIMVWSPENFGNVNMTLENN